jgi:prophage regulatory protein
MQPVSPAPTRRILRKPRVLLATGLSDTTLWRQVKAGRFPAPIKLSVQSVGWFEDEVLAWQQSRAAEREAEAGGR